MIGASLKKEKRDGRAFLEFLVPSRVAAIVN
jgi:hypothetical protein